MKKALIYLIATFAVTLTTSHCFAQASLDTTIIENGKIICYRSNTPGYGNYLPPVITDYIRIMNSVNVDSPESPKQKKVRIAKYLNEFSVEDSKNEDKELFLGYVAHLLICDPYKAPTYRDEYLEKIIEVKENSSSRINKQSIIVENLINDYMKLQKK